MKHGGEVRNIENSQQQYNQQSAPMRKKVFFTGNFWDYFFKTLGLAILTILTFGLLFPYLAWWQAKYFFNHLEIEA